MEGFLGYGVSIFVVLEEQTIHEVHFSKPHYPSNHVLKRISEYHRAYKASRVVKASPCEIVQIGWKPPLEGYRLS